MICKSCNGLPWSTRYRGPVCKDCGGTGKIGNNIWFTADLHLGHTNIIKYCRRPFGSAEEMNEVILERFNSVISPGDPLYIVGDLCWSGFDAVVWLKLLKTKELHLILGNHDCSGEGKPLKHIPTEMFRSVGHFKRITPEGRQVFMCHYPTVSWRNRSHGAYHLYGHVHGNYISPVRAMDVGVDTNGFMPYNWEDIKKYMEPRPAYAPKEHNEL